MGYGTVNLGYPVKIGKPGGVASLGADGKVPEAQLPEMNYDPAGSAAAALDAAKEYTDQKATRLVRW